MKMSGCLLVVAATAVAEWVNPDPDLSASVELAFGEVRLFVHDYSGDQHKSACSSLTVAQAGKLSSLEDHFAEMLGLLVDDILEQREKR